MLQPTRTKFRKAFKGRIHGKASRCSKLNYGQYGLKALQPERVIGKQIEAARVALTRYMKRTGKVWTRIFPNIPVSKKPTEVRMGKGKGSPEFWACRVKPGRILFTVIEFWAISFDNVFAHEATDPLIVLDIPNPWIGSLTEVEIIFIILPYL